MKYPFGKEEAIEVISEDKKTKNMQRFGIDLGGKIIGLIDLYNINLKSKKLKLGYWIGKIYRRKGYATEAIKKMIKYAFENFDVDEIIATTLVTNEASMSLLKKLGFEKGKVLKNDRFLDGKYIDSVQWTMKKKE
jgi:ribosomal-protein-alanine N-acetyltransferase